MFNLFKKKSIKISVCVPVCGTQKFLSACLESICSQSFCGFEVIVVDDEGIERLKEKKLNTRQILKEFCKKHKSSNFCIRFIQHEKNKGLVEARRSAVYAATGKYIMFVDSDDFLLPDALSSLYDIAEKKGADIVHGMARIKTRRELKNLSEKDKKFSENRILEITKKITNVFVGADGGSEGFLCKDEILNGFLVQRNHCGFLWAKLFERELCLNAFEKIPPVYCVFAEDFLIYFFLAFYAKKYAGIKNEVYSYCVDTGISSEKKIYSLEQWKKVCSAASASTVLLDFVQEKDIENKTLTESEIEELRKICRYYAKNNLEQLKKTVIPELQTQAYEELCEWWGKEMIKSVEK